MGNLTPELAAFRDETRDLARSYGLDFYEVIFELVDYDELEFVRFVFTHTLQRNESNFIFRILLKLIRGTKLFNLLERMKIAQK